MKKILVLMGSGHTGGNTDLLCNAFIEGAKAKGHIVNKIYLGNASIKGCLGCNACRYELPCVQQDDMQEIYPLLKDADAVVLGSPLYFWTLSASIKAFIERLYAIAIKDDNPPLGRYERYVKKDCFLLMSAADDLFWTFSQAVSYYQFAVVNYIGWNDCGMVLAGDCGGSSSPRHIATHHLDAAYLLGKQYQ